MKAIEILNVLEKSTRHDWQTFWYEGTYSSPKEFCSACFGKEAILIQMKQLYTRQVLVTYEPLKYVDIDAPIFDAVVVDPDGVNLNERYLYNIEG